MKLLVLKENNNSENRVAISLELVQKYQKLGFEIFIEKDAGLKSNIDNDEFEKNGAKICDDISVVINQIDIILSVQRIDVENFNFKNEAILICLANPYFQKEKIRNICEKNISLFALELLPRISRAQYIDVLSSQSNIAG
jgi:NAD(P) transhydrogenase subunit alpha